MAQCNSCGAEILWCKTTSGKRMPLDSEPTKAGLFVIEGDPKIDADEEGGPLARKASPGYWGEKYTSHFATCPDADRWRKR